MLTTSIKAIYNENVTHTLTINGTKMVDGSSTRYVGEVIEIPYKTITDWQLYKFHTIPDLYIGKLWDKDAGRLEMPDSDLTVTADVQHKNFRMNIAGEISASDISKSGNGDNDIVIPAQCRRGMEGSPEIVTSIKENGFERCRHLNSVVISNSASLTSIGNEAFRSCINLLSVEIPDNITDFGNHIFSDCENLTSVILPSNLTKITQGMFHNCTSLRYIDIPASVRDVEYEPFMGCYDITIQMNVERSRYQWLESSAPWGATNATVIWLD